MVIDIHQIRHWLEMVKDPEIPVLSISDLGVLRDVKIAEDGAVEVVITPTYSVCPAMNTIEEDIKRMFKRKGIQSFRIIQQIHPPWTTDWMSEEAREKLRKFGIAPPEGSADKAALLGKTRHVKCPQCGSTHTELKSQFGSTACKAMYQCQDCKEPFDYFKCL